MFNGAVSCRPNTIDMKREIAQKVATCKALKGKSIADVCHMDKFMENLSAYMAVQRKDRTDIQSSYGAMKKLGVKGYKLPAHTIDNVINISTEQFRDEFCSCLAGNNPRPAAQREYILQLGMQAYHLTVAQIVCEEFPELKETLIPTTKNS